MVWLTVAFIVIGFVILVSMKKGMERKLALLMENEESIGKEKISTNPIIWWIGGAVILGVISMFLIICSFLYI